MLVLSIAFSWLLGGLLLNLLWPWKTHSRAHFALQFFLSGALGIGITSCHFFLWLTFGGGTHGFGWSELAVALVLGGFTWFRNVRGSAIRADAPFASTRSSFRLAWLVAAAFGLVIACACVMFVFFLAREPHGLYDAVAMWNAKARIIYRSGGDWTGAVSPYVSHPDYPLLLPLSIARSWSYRGNDSTLVPAVLATLFTFGIVGLLASAVALLRSRTQGMLAGMVLVGPVIFLRFGSWQYADFPFALFALATLVFFCLYDYAPPNNRSLLVLAGLTAGFAAWTKNEGLLFVLVVLLGRTFVGGYLKGLRASRRELLWFSVGLVPLLLLVAYFKSRVAAPNDILAAQSLGSMVQKLGDVSRYKLIAKALLQQLLFFGDWDPNPTYLLALYPLSIGVAVEDRNKSGVLTAATVIGLLFVGYLVIYLLTPRDLAWHLETSLDRLLLQLWPGAVFLYFLIVKTPEAAIRDGDSRVSSDRPLGRVP